MFKQLPHTSRAFVGQKIFDFIKREKFTKGDVIKRIMKEQKQVFGALLETKREKAQRLKRENEGQFSMENFDTKVDSELSWMMNVSNTRIKRLNITGNNGTLKSENLSSDKIAMKKMSHICEKKNFKRVYVAQQKSNIEVIKIDSINSINGFRCPMITDNSMPKIADKPISRDICPLTLKSQEDSVFTSKISTSQSEHCKEVDRSSPTLTPEKTFKNKPVTLESPNHFLESKLSTPLFFEQNEESQDSSQSSEIFHIPATEDKGILKYPSVTRILNATMSETAKKRLEMWMAKMIEVLGQEGFDDYKRGLLENGKLLHASIDNTLRKLPVDVPENLRPCFNSVQTVLEEINHVRVIESHVVHPYLRYRGVIDCVASYKGNMCLIDWKKSDRVKSLLSSTYDAPLQIASYIGALNADKNYPFQINTGLIVVAYTTGNSPTVYRLDETKLQTYWKQWLGRLKKYYTMQNT